MRKKNLAVFISGFGSNLEIFLKNKEKFSKILVVSSNANAQGLARAQKHGVTSLILDLKIDWEKLHGHLVQENVDLIFLAGFMKILPKEFVKNWEGKLFNIHPSLLPKYKGLNAIKRAYDARDDIGVTIHKVTAEVDSGEIVDQKVAVFAQELKNLELTEAIEKTHACEHTMVANWIDLFSN